MKQEDLSFLKELRNYLKKLEEYHTEKEREIRDIINKLEKQRGIKTYIIRTSHNGYDPTLYTVQTEATIEDLKFIDMKCPRSRFTSTTIEKMKEIAKQEGFEFMITARDIGNGFTDQVDYSCSTGNY